MILLMTSKDIIRTMTLLLSKNDNDLIIEFDTSIILLCYGNWERGELDWKLTTSTLKGNLNSTKLVLTQTAVYNVIDISRCL